MLLHVSANTHNESRDQAGVILCVYDHILPCAMEDCTGITTDLTTALCVFANAVISDEWSGKDMWLSTWVQGFKVQVELWKIKHEDPRWLGARGPLAPTRFNPDR